MITIYGRANSINVRKVLWLCEDIGLAFDRLDYGRGFKPADSPELVALNPNALVPVVVDGDAAVWESNTCLRYLNARYGREELHPKEPLARARVESWMDWQLAHHQPTITPLFFARALKNPDFAKPDVEAGAIERTGKLMTLLAATIDKAGGYIAGPHVTLADYALGPGVHRWFALAPEADKPKPLADYYERLKQYPGARKWILTDAP